MFQLAIMKLEIESCPMKKKFEISQLLTWYHTICAEGAEDWWWCWTKSFQTFRFVAVSSPPTTWSRTTDHFPPIILMWFGYFFKIQSHIVNAFFKKNLQSISQANEMRCFLRSLYTVQLHRDGAEGQKGRRPSSRLGLRSFLRVIELALVHSFPQFLLR